MKVVPEFNLVGGSVPQRGPREHETERSDRRFREVHGDHKRPLPFALEKDAVVSLVLASMLMGWAVYGGWFIYLSSAVVGGVRYFFLLDDEMISMRYAANLAHGYGLVWNPHGAHVEGFTNPLWVFVMAFFHLLPLSLAKMSLLVELF